MPIKYQSCIATHHSARAVGGLVTSFKAVCCITQQGEGPITALCYMSGDNNKNCKVWNICKTTISCFVSSLKITICSLWCLWVEIFTFVVYTKRDCNSTSLWYYYYIVAKLWLVNFSGFAQLRLRCGKADYSVGFCSSLFSILWKGGQSPLNKATKTLYLCREIRGSPYTFSMLLRIWEYLLSTYHFSAA